ncbi:MAG: hypothetical protein OJF49_002804 [Ktedonobacterales bacterium]|nr:MAG: hypothetical protein OJF49_002804 [Ktedonobacterales bacterium]
MRHLRYAVNYSQELGNSTDRRRFLHTPSAPIWERFSGAEY